MYKQDDKCSRGARVRWKGEVEEELMNATFRSQVVLMRRLLGFRSR